MAISESSQLMSIDSFSYRWLVNLSQDPSFRFAIDGHERAADTLSLLPSSSGFIEMDPKLTPSKRFLKTDEHHFDFDLCAPNHCSSSEQPPPADTIFSNGKFINPPRAMEDGSKAVLSEVNNDTEGEKLCCRPTGSKSCPATPARLVFLGSPKRFIKCSSLRRCGSLSKRVLSRYLEFLWPICHVVKGNRGKSSSSARSKVAGSLDRHDQTGMKKLKRGSSSKVACSSPGSIDSSFPGRTWRMCESDTSIYEAVLHCKRSIGREDYSRREE